MQTTTRWWTPKATDSRPGVLYRRARELDGEIKPSIVRRQKAIYDQEKVAALLGRYVSEVENVVADVVSEVAQVYTVPPRRRLGEGATEEQQRAFRELVEESGANTAAPRWARHSLYSGPVLVVPNVDADDMGDSRLRLLHHLGYEWAVPPDTRRGFYPPEVVVLDWEDPERCELARAMLIDGDAWRWYDGRGYPDLVGPDGEKAARVVPHGLGFAPVAIFRASDAQADFWGVDLGRRAKDATIEAGWQWAELSYVRKTQNRKQLALILGEAESTRQQTLHPELPIELSDGSDLRAVDMTTDPKGFLDHIAAIKAAAFRAYGIPEADLRFMSDRGVAVTLARRNLLRQEQILWMKPAEQRLWKVALGVVARSGHRHARLFADWRDLEIVVEFPEIALVEDPKQREEVYQLQAARGASDPVREYQIDNPDLSDDEARDAVIKSIERSAEVADFKARRNLSDPANSDAGRELGFQTPAQVTGRQGGIESGNSRRSDDDE